MLRTFDESMQVAGQRWELLTRAVKVRVSVAALDFPLFLVVLKPTFHAIAVNGQWTWILSAEQYVYYSAGACPMPSRGGR